jgi:hypothetical protein
MTSINRRRAAPPPKTRPPKLELKRKTGSQQSTVPENISRRAGIHGPSIKKLASDKAATESKNRDGSVTRSKTSNGGQSTRELTTKKGLLGAEVRLTAETKTTGKKASTTTKDTFSAKTDAFGRATSSSTREKLVTKGNVTDVAKRTVAQDKFGNVQTSDKKGTETKKGNVTNGTSTEVKTDARGNKLTTVEQTKKTEGKSSTTTQTTTSATGSQYNTSSKAEYKNGKYTLSDSREWKDQSFNTTKSGSREWGKAKDDKGLSQVGEDKMSKAQKGLDVAHALGAKYDLVPRTEFSNKTQGTNYSSDPNSFVGSRTEVKGSQELSVGAGGLKGAYNREASAGLYAETRGGTDRLGYDAKAKLEAKATVDAKGKIDSNGLDAEVTARVGVRAEASISGHARTGTITVGGEKLDAGVVATGKVSAELQAEATGRAKVTRNPPTAVLEGTIGASAVVKAEAEIKANAGPFAVTASAYASAGAEAKATGGIKYENGKLSINGSIGAALGVGAGTNVAVEVDVKQIGNIAKDVAVKTADVNGDGKLGLDDAKAAASNVAHAAANKVNEVASAVKSWLPW